MFISEIVQQHGTPVKVGCGKPGYSPFTVVDQPAKDRFVVKYEDGKHGVVNDSLGDYRVVEKQERMIPCT